MFTVLKKNILYLLITVLITFSFQLTGCSSKKVIVPPIVDNVQDGQQQHHAGKFVWFDLFTTDIDAVIPFYSKLLGWEFVPVESSKTIFTILYNDSPIGNITLRQKKEEGSKWLSYLSVDNVDSTIQSVTENNGEVINNIGLLPERGTVAILADNQQATFAIIHSSSGDPEDREYEAGYWMGAELWTFDVEQAVNFYTLLAGYQISDVQLDDAATYTMLVKDGYRRGGIVKIPWKDVEPEWVPYIAVDDIEGIVKQVEDLGGRLLLAPEFDTIESKVAIIADPSGAPLGIQQLQ